MSLRDTIAKRCAPEKNSLLDIDMMHLPLLRYAIVYKRLSTYEQIHSSIFSIERQHQLEDIAIRDGYKPGMTKEEIVALKDVVGYPGFYKNGQIIVIESDLGRSGCSGQEKRPGLAMMMEFIRKDVIESIYAIDISRIFRDNKLISAPAFAVLCKEHNVIVINEG
jgi:DNA invertase Pin-like site-specific DNA recombinase